MKALEFAARLNDDQSLTVPAELARQIPPDQACRVLVLVPEADGEKAWEELAAQEFAQGYADSDAIYDQLSSR